MSLKYVKRRGLKRRFTGGNLRIKAPFFPCIKLLESPHFVRHILTFHDFNPTSPLIFEVDKPQPPTSRKCFSPNYYYQITYFKFYNWQKWMNCCFWIVMRHGMSVIGPYILGVSNKIVVSVGVEAIASALRQGLIFFISRARLGWMLSH